MSLDPTMSGLERQQRLFLAIWEELPEEGEGLFLNDLHRRLDEKGVGAGTEANIRWRRVPGAGK